MAFVFLLLTQESLTLITKSSQPPLLVFPKTMVNHQEIVDRKAFEALLQDFFSHYLKLEATVLLSNEIVFEKAISLTEEVVLEDEIKKFIESVPFPSAIVEKKVIKTKSAAYLYAANSDLYKTIIVIAQQNAWKVKSVLPLSVYAQILQGKELSYNNLLQIVKQNARNKEADFLQIEDKKPATPKNMPVKQLLMLVVCLMFLGTAIWFALDNLGLLPKPSSETPPASTQVVSPTIQKTQQPSPSLVVSPITSTKEEIAIQIFNGSGIAGQATQVKNQLNAIGFTNIQTGNTAVSVSTSSATTVAFSDKVSAPYKNEILTELKTTFTNVVTQQNQLSEDYDVSITTGKE